MPEAGDVNTERDQIVEDADDLEDEFSDDVDDLADGYLEDHHRAMRPKEDCDESTSDEDFEDSDFVEDEDLDEDYAEYEEEYEEADARYERRPSRPYRPGRGGFDPEAAAITARARYAFRQRIVVAMLLAAVITAVAAILAMPMLWWAHGVVDATLVGYLTYLRRQVRIEDEIRQRRTARLGTLEPVEQDEADYEPMAEQDEAYVVDEAPARPPVRAPLRPSRPRPGTVIVDADDSDPMFDELAEPDVLPYRRAVGE